LLAGLASLIMAAKSDSSSFPNLYSGYALRYGHIVGLINLGRNKECSKDPLFRIHTLASVRHRVPHCLALFSAFPVTLHCDISQYDFESVTWTRSSGTAARGTKARRTEAVPRIDADKIDPKDFYER
jgi:hypothetical protein